MEEIASQIEQARELLAEARRVAVLTGAGVSAESGVPTFRGAGGLWQGERVEAVASPGGFQRDPERVWRFYRQRLDELDAVTPNPAHEALAALQRRTEDRGGELTLATQNIDGLHQAAGCRNVLELHGSLRRMRCNICCDERPIDQAGDQGVPTCEQCGGPMRPSVVWFGEMLPQGVWQRAARAVETCDTFLTIGTAAVVYPAASLIDQAVYAGADTIEVNLERTSYSRTVTLSLRGRAGEILPRIVS